VEEPVSTPFYLVTLKLHIGKIEKTAKHLIQAIGETAAVHEAFLMECHGEPEIDNNICWDLDHELAYSCLSVVEIPYHQALILRPLLSYC
jgi:hypothetical protein